MTWEWSLRNRISMKKSIDRYLLFGMIAILCWSIWPLLASLAKDVPPFLATSIYLFTAFLTLAMRRNLLGQPVMGFFKAPLGVILAGGFGMFGYALFFNLGVRTADPVVVSLIVYLWPIITLMILHLWKVERMGLIEFSGTGVCFIGLFFVLNAKLANFYKLGVVFALLSALSWAIYNSYRIAHTSGPKDVFGAYCALAGVCAVLASLYLQESFDISVYDFIACMLVGVIPVAIGNTLWDNASAFGDSSTLMHMAYITPVLSTLILFVTGEGLVTLYTGLGIVFVVGGLFLSAHPSKSP